MNKIKKIFSIDIRALALMRMGLALLILADLWMRSRHLIAHYTDEGVLPRLQVINLLSSNTICAYLMGSSVGFTIALFVLAALLAVCVFIGYRTTLVTCLSWFLLQSLHARNLWVNNGGDIYFQSLLFWGMFLPWGAIWSIDSLKKKHQEIIPQQVLTMATVGLMLQIALFYTFAGIHKTDPDWSKEGTALYYAIHMDEYARPIAHFLLQFPLLLKYSSLGIYYFECCAASLMFIPFFTKYIRMFLISIFYLLHLSIFITFETGLFQFTAMVGLIAFWPSFVLDKLFKPFKQQYPNELIVADKNHFSWFKPPIYVSLILLFFISYIFVLNVETLKNPFARIPPQLRWVQSVFYLDQPWNMFSPVNKETGWLVIPGKLRNGEIVDVFKKGDAVLWEKPYSIVDLYEDSLWAKYDFNLHSTGKRNLLFYGQYLCRDWNKRHPQDSQLVNFDIYFMRELTLPNNETSRPTRNLLWSHYCFENKNVVPTISTSELPAY